MSPAIFAHGHLRLYLLSLLAASDTGMHGYELIQALGDRFGGTYVPSAGTIYPRLAKLEDEGMVSKASDGRKTVYTITEAGRAELAARQDELGDIEDGVTDSVRRLADDVRASVDEAMRSLRAELAAAAREARTEAKQEGRDAERTARDEAAFAGAASRVQLQHAEAAVARFRADVRSELRAHVARGGDLPPAAVEALRTGLDSVRDAVLGALK